MWLPTKESGKYSSTFRLVEVMRYFPHLKRPARVKIDGNTFIDIDGVEAYADTYKRLGIYVSIFQRNTPDVNCAALSNLYFDLDSAADFGQTKRDALRLADALLTVLPESGLHLYFSGKKGFHLECEALALGIEAAYDNSRYYRYIANQLGRELNVSTIDYVVYEPRRVWRLANSIHQETGHFKVELDLDDLRSWTDDELFRYASQPRQLHQTPQTLCLSANEWYRSMVTKFDELEAEQQELQRQRFLEYGTSLLHESHSLEDEIIALKHAPQGRRNNALNRAAFNMGHLILEGKISEEEVRQRLKLAALEIRLSPGEIMPTIESGLRAGMRVTI